VVLGRKRVRTTREGTDLETPSPQQVPGEGWKAVSAGDDHTCGVREDGTLWWLGGNWAGQLGTAQPRTARRPSRSSKRVGQCRGGFVSHLRAQVGRDTVVLGRELVGQLGSQGSARATFQSKWGKTRAARRLCGDGRRTGGAEACDDGKPPSGRWVLGPVSARFCGDGVLQPALGEQCDDGNTLSGDGCDWIVSPGDLRRWDSGGFEECDDGNTIDGDGCSAQCRKSIAETESCSRPLANSATMGTSSTGTAVTGTVSERSARWGSGGNEECDDGNTIDGRRLLGDSRSACHASCAG